MSFILLFTLSPSMYIITCEKNINKKKKAERKREMRIEKKEKEFFGAHHVAYQQPSTITPTTLEFLNVIFLFCLHSLYERNFCLLPSFLEPCSFLPYPLHCSHLSNATSLSITSWPILEHLVFFFSLSLFLVFFLSFSLSLSLFFLLLLFHAFERSFARVCELSWFHVAPFRSFFYVVPAPLSCRAASNFVCGAKSVASLWVEFIG